MSKMSLLPHIEINPASEATASVIWLHGLGANGHDFEPIVAELNLPPDLAVRFIFPHAPSRPVTINAGYVMPAWYDILELSLDRKIDTEHLLQSAAQIKAFVDHEIGRGIASSRVILAGFSQGGAVAYQVALTYPQPLAGLLALSTYLATPDLLAIHPANCTLPIAIHHGQYDAMVPESLGERARDWLVANGLAPEFSCYPMDHEVCQLQVADIAAWLQQRLT